MNPGVECAPSWAGSSAPSYEGKGAVVAHIAKEYRHHVRVGAANAGHTLYTKGVPTGGDWTYEKHVMQQVPCAAYANPEAILYIGPGAQISPGIFAAEVDRLAAWRSARGMRPAHLFVDRRAHLITVGHIAREAESGLAERIGSTSTIAREGIGAAQAARVMREDSCVTAGDLYDDVASDLPLVLTDVPRMLHLAGLRENVLLEGTQGTGLSLTTGHFPYTTSRNTTAAGLCADAGVAPTRLDRVVLVCRTYPIRVAGNSGPFHPGSEEIDWEDIGVDPESERTTVTRKIRRVATFSVGQVQEAVRLNGATEIALMFCDYVEPKIAGVRGVGNEATIRADLPKLYELVKNIEIATGVPVTMLGTGPHTMIDVRRAA